MQNLLMTWLEDCNQKRIPIGTTGTDEKEEIVSEGEGCLKGNFDKGTRADVSKFGNC
jgi:hypothetical protein